MDDVHDGFACPIRAPPRAKWDASPPTHGVVDEEKHLEHEMRTSTTPAWVDFPASSTRDAVGNDIGGQYIAVNESRFSSGEVGLPAVGLAGDAAQLERQDYAVLFELLGNMSSSEMITEKREEELMDKVWGLGLKV